MVAGNSTPRMGKSGRGGKRGAKMSYGGAEDEELAELQKRFHALEEEARVTAERAQSLPGSTTATPRLHVRVARERDSTSAVRAENEAELAKLDGDIASLRRRHDELAHANMEKRRELERLTDRLSDLTKESKLPSADDSPIMKEIRVLEARLQKAVVKYEDAQEVRRTYEQIVKRLKEERIGFANQLEVREATMGGKESDYEELLLMSHDANQARAPARARARPPRRPLRRLTPRPRRLAPAEQGAGEARARALRGARLGGAQDARERTRRAPRPRRQEARDQRRAREARAGAARGDECAAADGEEGGRRGGRRRRARDLGGGHRGGAGEDCELRGGVPRDQGGDGRRRRQRGAPRRGALPRGPRIARPPPRSDR